MTRLLPIALLALSLSGCPSPEPATQAAPPKNPPADAPADVEDPESTDAETDVEDPTPAGVTVEKPRWTDEDGNPVESPTPRTRKRWNGLVTGNWKEPIEGVAPDERCVVLHTKVGSPAREAGLEEMDVIVTSGGIPVKTYQDYIAGAKTVEIGESLELEIVRAGERKTLQVGMAEKPDNMITWQKQKFPGSAAGEFSLPLLRPADGGTIGTADQNGRLQVLYFWATWCGPCRTTSPEVSKLHDELSDAVQVIGVSSEEGPVISAYVEKHPEYTYPVGHDDERALKRRFEVKKLPTIALVDSEGKVVDWDISVSGVRRITAKARELAASK